MESYTAFILNNLHRKRVYPIVYHSTSRFNNSITQISNKEYKSNHYGRTESMNN